MLAYIKGNLEIKNNDYIVIDVGGLGYKVNMSKRAIEKVGNIGDKVKVYTYYRVREDDISIFGFNTNEELRMFELLLSVSGIGAKVALTILSSIELAEFALAVITDDVTKMSIGVGFYDDNGEYLSDVSTWNVNTKSFTTDSYGNVLIVLCPTVTNQPITFSNIQLEVGKAVTEYEEYKGVQTVVANTDGTVEGLTSVSPNMTVLTDTEGVNIDCTYNADTKMYIDNKISELL